MIAALPGRVLEVFCRVDLATARRRWDERAARRHPGHFDGERNDHELWGEEVSSPVAGGWPVIEVDTRAEVNGRLVARRVRQAAQSG